MIFDPVQIINALIGGGLIGLSASLMLLLNGRIAGVSGIFSGAFSLSRENFWKAAFIVGLILGGFFLKIFLPTSFTNTLAFDSTKVIIAGFLVGLGTRLGSGCTSGHGVCGISRLSFRSIAATLAFIISGILTVYVFGASNA